MMEEHAEQCALVYCRVSSKKQKKEGHGLASQETLCREYACAKGYRIIGVYQDDLTGAILNRPGMKEMLLFLRKHRADKYVVIIDDMSRLARHFRNHFDLRDAITLAGGKLESPTYVFGDDPDSEFQELILAGIAHTNRRKNAEQTKRRMRARVMNGYYPFKKPLGYRYVKRPGEGKVLVREEPVASILKEALEGYASGRFQLQAEVRRFLESHPEFPKNSNNGVFNQKVSHLLKLPVYAGLIEAPMWGISLKKGLHPPLISVEDYNKIQARLTGSPIAPARADLHVDFPLRGFVLCSHCSTPLTGCWSTGRSGRYAYYLCRKSGCVRYGKSIKREAMEAEFGALVRSLQPTPELFKAFRRMFEKIWAHRLVSGQAKRKSLETERKKISKEVELLLDRITKTDVDSVAKAYERRVRDREAQRQEIDEKIKNCGRPLRDFDGSLRTAFDFLENPGNLWVSERFEEKMMLLKLAFGDKLTYDPEGGFRTANLALPFRALSAPKGGECKYGGPYRTRTYNQLIKSQHKRSEKSRG